MRLGDLAPQKEARGRAGVDLQRPKARELRGGRSYAASGRLFLMHCVELANNSDAPGSEGSADIIRIRKLESTYCTVVRANNSIASHESSGSATRNVFRMVCSRR